MDDGRWGIEESEASGSRTGVNSLRSRHSDDRTDEIGICSTHTRDAERVEGQLRAIELDGVLDEKDRESFERGVAEIIDPEKEGRMRPPDPSNPGGEGFPARRLAKVDLQDGDGIQEVWIISWADDDPENPFNWSTTRKYTITISAGIINVFTAANVTSPSIMADFGAEWFGVSREEFIISLSITLLSISFTPMVLAPLSEVYGRNWIYQITSIMTALLFIPQSLSRSYAGLIAARWFQGMSSSVGNSMVTGSIADIFRPANRGFAMGFFSLLVFVGQALGGMAGGWVVMNWGVAWCYGVQGIAGAISCLLNFLFLRETRADVLLDRKAKLLTRQTGIRHITATDLEKKDWRTVMSVSLIRPFQFLFTEPIVTALSTWIAFAWACIFLGGTSVLLVFEQYGFNVGELGMFQTPVLLGGILGFATNYHQSHLYNLAASRHGGKAPPEARLYWAAYGGLMFPLAMFIFAWTGQPSVPWPIPAVALVIANWGVYCMYTGVFNYLADAYETYSSSAQAAQSLARNVFSAVFPLFGRQLYIAMGYPQATTLVASLALLLAAAPILLIRYGKTLRARSKVTSALVGD